MNRKATAATSTTLCVREPGSLLTPEPGVHGRPRLPHPPAPAQEDPEAPLAFCARGEDASGTDVDPVLHGYLVDFRYPYRDPHRPRPFRGQGETVTSPVAALVHERRVEGAHAL